MVTMGVFRFQGKTHMLEPGIEPGTSWLVVRNSDHQATRLINVIEKVQAAVLIIIN